MIAHPRCVLVDDDPDFVSFVRVCLWRVCPNLEIATFATGVDALAFLAQHETDLLITDFRMPMVNGLELTTEVRSSGANWDLPIIIMSEDDIEEKALANGANVFLAKRDLTSRLAAILERFGMCDTTTAPSPHAGRPQSG